MKSYQRFTLAAALLITVLEGQALAGAEGAAFCGAAGAAAELFSPAGGGTVPCSAVDVAAAGAEGCEGAGGSSPSAC